MAVLELLTGPAFLLFLAGAGIFFTCKLKGMQFFQIGRIWKATFGGLSAKKEKRDGAISPFQATATALAGTLGTGNIAGVATAIVSGGPGAVFWMWLSSLFAMAIKYAEIFLSVRFRTVNANGEQIGGPMYYMEKGLHCRWMAVWFSAACVLASFGIGNMAQANAAAQSVSAAFGIPEWAVGLGLMCAIGMVLFGGITKIAKWTERVIPFLAVFYLGASAWALWGHRGEIPEVISLIVQDAFDFSAAAGGIFGFLVCRGIRYGVARGVFSNEAGMGSAPIIHGAADARSPADQGMWGIIEVFLDTTVMCSITALVILTSGVPFAGKDGAALTLAAFETVLGRHGVLLLAVSILFFAAASILGWSYCGEKSMEYLHPGKRSRSIYRILYLCAVLAGAVFPLDFVWTLSDLLNLAMAVPNVLAVLLLSSHVTAKKSEKITQK
ncbi:MAG TPA: sodium:alanine symporter family protein [Candidatus Merdivicinus intestinigallinarum]|nr:sodium:alanine symporter family protein [Candidatus Merdivicinus intestinigallinarum]